MTYRDGVPGTADRLASGQTLRGLHGNGTDSVLSGVLGNLKDEAHVVALHFEGVQNLGHPALKLHVHNGSNHLHHAVPRVSLSAS
jgi:hypothetical protein